MRQVLKVKSFYLSVFRVKYAFLFVRVSLTIVTSKLNIVINVLKKKFFKLLYTEFRKNFVVQEALRND